MDRSAFLSSFATPLSVALSGLMQTFVPIGISRAHCAAVILIPMRGGVGSNLVDTVALMDVDAMHPRKVMKNFTLFTQER